MDARRLVLGVVAAGVCVAVLAWLVRPSARREARPGAVLPGGAVIAWAPGYRVSFFGIERLHPFDIGKYDRIAAGLVSDGWLSDGDFAVPEPVSEDLLAEVHDPAYLQRLHEPRHLSKALEVAVPDALRFAIPRRVLEPFRTATGGTVAATRGALEHGVGINIGGGYHHARPALGHGFCIYNDVAVALHVLRREGFDGRVLIVDTDAHQGDGNHAFFADDPDVYSLSMHQGNLFPEPKLVGDEDLELAAGMGDAALISRLEERLPAVIEQVQPALLIHVAGADVLEDDPLAGLAMTPDGLVLRDRLVLREALRHDVPLLHLLAGGYGPSAATAQQRSVAAMLADLSPSVER